MASMSNAPIGLVMGYKSVVMDSLLFGIYMVVIDVYAVVTIILLVVPLILLSWYVSTESHIHADDAEYVVSTIVYIYQSGNPDNLVFPSYRSIS